MFMHRDAEDDDTYPRAIWLATGHFRAKGYGTRFALVTVSENCCMYISKDVVLPAPDKDDEARDFLCVLHINGEWIMFRAKVHSEDQRLLIRQAIRKTSNDFWQPGCHCWYVCRDCPLPSYENLPDDICNVDWSDREIVHTSQYPCLPLPLWPAVRTANAEPD